MGYTHYWRLARQITAPEMAEISHDAAAQRATGRTLSPLS
jgi:hypothetical protein